MFTPSTQSFIFAHRNDDVRQLALRAKCDPDVDLKAALEQIAGWQAARHKLPLWAQTEGIVYPPHLAMEQCSSEPTALYKAAVAQRLTGGVETGSRELLLDLTGGFGVDFSYMARGFKRALYVERQEQLCRIAEHNFSVLGLSNATVKTATAEDVLAAITEASLIYIDPARRDTAGRRTFAISDCTPDVLALKDTLLSVSPTVMVKLSPMLDCRKAVSDFSGSVSEVHIVAVKGECKELLLVLNRRNNAHCQVYCVNDSQVLTFNTALSGRTNPAPTEDDGISSLVTHNPPLTTHNYSYLSEPNAAVMKAGCFALLERRYGVRQIGTNSHLFVSTEEPVDFPGRVFGINGVYSLSRCELKVLLSDVNSANITTRNFPLSVSELRKRLRLKDGGDCYLFATTDQRGRHIIIKCHKMS